jgi:hypothetical protein
LLEGSTGLELTEGDVSAAGVRRAGDSLIVIAAISPGEKQLTLQYQLPIARTTVELPVGEGLALNVMAEEPGVQVSAPGIAPVDTQVIQGRSFRRWTGTVPANGVLRIRLPGLTGPPRWILPTLVSALAAALLATGLYGLARSRRS